VDRTAGHRAELAAAAEYGRVCAVAAEGQRDLRRCAATYAELFPADPFDPALFNAVALANACGSPTLAASRLRFANRSALWVFAVDWAIDYRAASREEVRDIVRRCLAVAGGAEPAPADGLARFLGDIRDSLVALPAFDTLSPFWREELRRMLDAMAREWDWNSAGGANTTLPTFDEYLANADNFGSSFVNVSLWIAVGDGSPGQLNQLVAAGREVQRVLRLLNDLATYDRDLRWGDLNALMLGVTRADVTRRIAELVERCRDLLLPLRETESHMVSYLERQIGFSMGFYGVSDYWGSLWTPPS
jgi:hypothetical protein